MADRDARSHHSIGFGRFAFIIMVKKGVPRIAFRAAGRPSSLLRLTFYLLPLSPLVSLDERGVITSTILLLASCLFPLASPLLRLPSYRFGERFFLIYAFGMLSCNTDSLSPIRRFDDD